MASGNGSVQRNFHLPSEQAEWLREHAHSTRRPQAEIVREALAEYRARSERPAQPAADDRNRTLTQRFSQGRGVDLDVLRGKDDKIWNREA